MNKNFLMIITLFVLTVFLAGCSQQASIPSTQTNTNAAATPAVNPAVTPTDTNSNSATASTSGTVTTPSTNASAPIELDIEAYNFGFKVLNNVQINKGDTVKLVVTSAEGTHGLSMPAFNVNIGPVSPGDVKTAEFVADQSGTFDYFCNVPCGPGHRDMKSTLIVN